MTYITSSIDFLYLIKTSWCRWILYSPQLFTITRKIFSFPGCSWYSEKLLSNAPIEHFAKNIGAVKWHSYNFEAKVISFVKQSSIKFSIFNVNVKIKEIGTKIAIIFFLKSYFFWINILLMFSKGTTII